MSSEEVPSSQLLWCRIAGGTLVLTGIGHLATELLAPKTPEQRTVFVLHEVEGHTLAEVSAMTGTGISTLHARLVAGRKRLDAALASIGVESIDAEPSTGGARGDGDDAA